MSTRAGILQEPAADAAGTQGTIVVISGLPRSGTSMMAGMLQAGGLEILTDQVRAADADNPRGYFELERVKSLEADGDPHWIEEAKDRGIKVISYLLKYLPPGQRYKVIFMRRNLAEVEVSQRKMLARRQAPPGPCPADMIKLFEGHLVQVASLIEDDERFDVLEVDYTDVLADPDREAHRVNQFLGGRLDVEQMVKVVDGALYRNRADL